VLFNVSFISRQIVDSTWKSQACDWEKLILNYAKHKRLFRLELHKATTSSEHEIFVNKKINRRLSFETLQEIIEEMVKKGTQLKLKKKKSLTHVYMKERQNGKEDQKDQGLRHCYTGIHLKNGQI
jgi:hypothetical protein